MRRKAQKCSCVFLQRAGKKSMKWYARQSLRAVRPTMSHKTTDSCMGMDFRIWIAISGRSSSWNLMQQTRAEKVLRLGGQLTRLPGHFQGIADLLGFVGAQSFRQSARGIPAALGIMAQHFHSSGRRQGRIGRQMGKLLETFFVTVTDSGIDAPRKLVE